MAVKTDNICPWKTEIEEILISVNIINLGFTAIKCCGCACLLDHIKLVIIITDMYST